MSRLAHSKLSSLHEGEFTFTRSGVLDILKAETYTPRKNNKFRPSTFVCHDFTLRKEIDGGYDSDYRPGVVDQRVRDWISKWREHIASAGSGVQSLDEYFSKLLKCAFQPSEPNDIIVAKVYNLLARLPTVPLEFRDPDLDPHYAELRNEHFLPGMNRAWTSLCFAHFVSRNVIRMALEIVQRLHNDDAVGGIFANFINTMSDALRAAIDLSKKEISTELFIVKAYLWTSWQRMILLYYHWILAMQLPQGYMEHVDIVMTPLKGLDIFKKAIDKSAQNRLDTQVPSYMCNWALRVLQEDKAIVVRDYRRFFQRFSHAFPGHSPRCLIPKQGNPSSCDNRYPDTCLRLSGMTVVNQSAHRYTCNRHCIPLYWNEQSWKTVGGAAAVALDLGPDGLLHYVEASERTLAVSHVWSNGQGGRPENNALAGGTGLNSCLHQRYRNIAIGHGCDSYWMDTPCIPTDHSLRNDAIANINSIFANSKITLICDRDLMDIDVRNLDITVQECLLAALLVCDWNVRAWTLLEALRGRKSLHLLCKEDRVVSLTDIARAICQEGCLEFAGLILSAQHLMPAHDYMAGKDMDSDTGQSNEWMRDSGKGFVSLEEAANLLSLRHASRPGDEIVIWSLLIGDSVSYTAKDFWSSRIGTDWDPYDLNDPFPKSSNYLRTGWLISDSPRMEEPGFSWAPSRPNFPLSKNAPRLNYDRLFLAYNGHDTRVGKVTKAGLHAYWSANIFAIPILTNPKHLLRKFGRIVGFDPLQSIWSDIERAGLLSMRSQYKWCAVLMPLTGSVQRIDSHPRRPSKDIFAVIASVDKHIWHWKGLLEIDKGLYNLDMLREQDFTIA